MLSLYCDDASFTSTWRVVLFRCDDVAGFYHQVLSF